MVARQFLRILESWEKGDMVSVRMTEELRANCVGVSINKCIVPHDPVVQSALRVHMADNPHKLIIFLGINQLFLKPFQLSSRICRVL